LSLYLDTSCLLKLLFPEPETAAVAVTIEAEDRVVVSSLGRLEALSQLQARVAGGVLRPRAATLLREKLDTLLASEPYEVVALPPSVVERAVEQIAFRRRAPYCRTLDRLHLAAMEVSGVKRLLTNDDTQAKVARSLGFKVLLPR
jgi:predicted nucleic acid-binding protein